MATTSRVGRLRPAATTPDADDAPGTVGTGIGGTAGVGGAAGATRPAGPAGPVGPVATVRHWRRRARLRATAVCLILVGAVFVAACAATLVGSYDDLSLPQVALGAIGVGDDMTVYVVRQLRIPRSAVAFVVGAAFGIAGAAFQSLARNPLASPDIVGISTGASLGAVLVIVTVGTGAVLVPVAAFCGAIAASALIVMLSLRTHLAPLRLILVGIGIQAVLSSIIGVLLTRQNQDVLEQANRWLIGSINARGWVHAGVMLLALVLFGGPLLALTKPLRQLQLGESVAQSTGLSPRSPQIAAVVLGCALTAAAVSVAGPISLIAFLGPPIARSLIGSPGPALLSSAVVSGAILVSADLVARFGIGDLHFPVGVLTGLLGAPVLLWVLLRQGRRRG